MVAYIEGVPLTLELSRGVDLVSHDAGNWLFHILHPLSHLGVAHLVHLLDELVVFLPERHLQKLYNPENRRKGLKHFRFHYRFRIRLQRLVGWSFWTVKKHAPRWNLKILIAPRCILFNRTVQPKNSHQLWKKPDLVIGLKVTFIKQTITLWKPFFFLVV